MDGEFRDCHEALPCAPSGTPADMAFVTMKLGKSSHTFVGPPDQVNTWLVHMRTYFPRIRDYMIVFSEYEHGFLGESVSSETTFLPGRHYRIQAFDPPDPADPNRAPCQLCPPSSPLELPAADYELQ